MRKGRKKLNQAGMSLLELIVVILIIGILSAGSGAGLIYVNRMNASTAADNLASMLDRTRMLTLSSTAEVKMELSYEGNNYYAKLLQGGAEIDRVRLGNGGVTVKVTDEAGDLTNIKEDGSCEFSYNKSNGAFADSCDYTSVEIIGTKTSMVYLVNATGRCFVK